MATSCSPDHKSKPQGREHRNVVSRDKQTGCPFQVNHDGLSTSFPHVVHPSHGDGAVFRAAIVENWKEHFRWSCLLQNLPLPHWTTCWRISRGYVPPYVAGQPAARHTPTANPA